MPSRSGQRGSYVSPYQITVSFGDSASPAKPADWFGPLSPLKPMAPPQIASRQWDFPSGYNLTASPRADEPVTFATLRALADGYDLLRLVIETRKDQVARMAWTIKPRSQTAISTHNPQIQTVKTFFRRPDGIHNFSDWLRILLEDLFVLDAPALYKHRNYGDKLIGLPPLDGAAIKPVIDDWGRTPQPYQIDGETIYPAAYQQILKGCPAVNYSTRDLLYRPRNVRVNRAYGYSPVEQIVTTVSIALRKQIFTLEYYTSGNIPDSLIGVPETWTPDQIASYQKYWDAYIEGDLGRRRKAKFVPGGMAKTFIQTKEPELKTDFDEWLARICCFAFSVSPQPFVTQMNRTSAETQKDLAEEEGLRPILAWVKHLIDEVIETEFGAPQLEFVWKQDQPIDPSQQATILSTYVKTGVQTINEARAQLGMAPLDDPAANQAMTLGANGYVGIGAGLAQENVNKGVIPVYELEPRIPKHNHGGGEWTRDGDGGAPLDDGVYRPERDGPPKLTPIQEEGAGEGSTFRSFGRRAEDLSPLEAMRMDATISRLNAAVARVQQVDPNWTYSYLADPDRTVDQEVDLLESLVSAANARYEQITAGKICPPPLSQTLGPTGPFADMLTPGLKSTVLTAPSGTFYDLFRGLTDGAVPTQGPASYKGSAYLRPDGVMIGLRQSSYYGPTIDVLKSAESEFDNGFKVHQK